MDLRTEIVDYARPCMEAEHALKMLHQAALEKDYAKAQEWALTAITEARLTMVALQVMEKGQR